MEEILCVVNNFIMPGSRDQFYQKEPSRILEKATKYATTLNAFHELPKATSKSMVVRQVAKNERQEIDYAINHTKYQLELYRQKEQKDLQTRTNYDQKWRQTIQKINKNGEDIVKKKEKKAEDYNKHLVNIYRRYQDEERKHRDNEKEQAYKLRKNLQEFYQKEEERKKEAEYKQVSVGTQYRKAVQRINRIHQQNQHYSQRAQLELSKELRRNNHSNQILSDKRRALSAMNTEKSKIFDRNLEIFDGRETQFIQKYGKNEDGSLKAWRHKEEDEEKTKKRLNQFFKKRVEHWAIQKKRVDDKKAEVPQKCLDILDKTSKSAFNRTVSSFRNSSLEWKSVVRKNKSLIRERDELRKDEIMDSHLDLRLKNTSSFKISERMGSMRQHARKMANSYL